MRRTTLAALAITVASFLFGSTFVVIKEAVASVRDLLRRLAFLIGGLSCACWRFREEGIWRDAAICGSLLSAVTLSDGRVSPPEQPTRL